MPKNASFHNRVPHWPVWDEREQAALDRVLKSRAWWRGVGHEADAFEQEFGTFLGAHYVRLTASGSGALEIALQLGGVGPGSEVLVPACTFISTASSVLRLGAYPIPVDVDPGTLCMDIADVKRKIGPRVRCVIPVHMAGQGVDMDALMAVASDHGLFVIEDAAHAHGAKWRDRFLGMIGHAAIFSFQAGKLMTAGEGGAVVTNAPDLAERTFMLHSCGRPRGDTEYRHSVIAGNWRPLEFAAAVLRAQLERLPEQIAHREKAATIFDEEMAAIPGVSPLERDRRATVHSHYMSMFRFDTDRFGGRSASEISAELRAMGIPAFRCFPPVHRTGMFSRNALDMAVRRADTPPPDYGQLETPHAERAGQEVVWFHHALLLGDRALLKDVARAVAALASVSGPDAVDRFPANS